MYFGMWVDLDHICTPGQGKAITRVQTLPYVHISRYSNGRISVVRDGHMVGRATSSTRTVYIDVTLTRSKVKVKATEHLNVPQLPITAHF